MKLVFTSPYKGGTKTWSTKLHVTGGNWQDQTHFDTFSDAVWADWITATYPRATLVETVGYNPGSDLPVFSKSYGAAGTQTLGSQWYAPLETCIVMRFTTDARSVKNHPVYLFNYIHCVPTAGATSPDSPSSGLTSTWNTRAAILVAGYSDGTLTRKRAGPNGAVAQAGATLTYLHHRDFPT